MLLKDVTEKRAYDQLVCGLFWHRDERLGSAFPLTATYEQKAIWMTCQHVGVGTSSIWLCDDAFSELAFSDCLNQLSL